jgi:hypothetical protein
MYQRSVESESNNATTFFHDPLSQTRASLSHQPFAQHSESERPTETLPTMIAMLSHDPRLPPSSKGRPEYAYRHPSSSRLALTTPPLENSSFSSSSSPILTCQFVSDGPTLDSTELSAAQALLNLTPSSSYVPQQRRPVFRDFPAKEEGREGLPPRFVYQESSSRASAPAIASHRGGVPSRRTPPPLLPRTVAVAASHPEVVTSDSLSTDDSSDDDDDEEASFYGRNYYTTFYEGNASLALDTDEDFLSPLHCFMRKYCVEAFSATVDDAIEPRHGGSHHNHGRVVVGQVGIRCLHCKHRPSSQRAERAVCFPSSLKNIYHSIETWQRRHSLVCQDIPDWVKREMTGLIQGSKSCAGGRRGYWEESAARTGLADTETGIRFVRKPGDVGPAPEETSFVSSTNKPGHPVVEPEDRALVTDYLFLLLDQMETCKFSEEDRAGGRSKVKSCPVGFPGMQCKHCAGKAGFGRYFPANLGALTSANSDRNIFNHIQKCRRCPTEVKQDLLRLREEYQRHKNRRGSRKVFFQRVWDRLHN